MDAFTVLLFLVVGLWACYLIPANWQLSGPVVKAILPKWYWYTIQPLGYAFSIWWVYAMYCWHHSTLMWSMLAWTWLLISMIASIVCCFTTSWAMRMTKEAE